MLVDLTAAACSCVSSYCTVGFWKPTGEGGAGKCAKVWNEIMAATALFEIQIIGALILLFVIYCNYDQLRWLRSQTLFGLLCACSILLMLVMSSSCHYHVSWLHSLVGWIIYVVNYIQEAYDWFEGDNCFKRVGWCVVQNHVAAGLHVVTIIPQRPKCIEMSNLSENWTNAWKIHKDSQKIPKVDEHCFVWNTFLLATSSISLGKDVLQGSRRKVCKINLEKWKNEKSKSGKVSLWISKSRKVRTGYFS